MPEQLPRRASLARSVLRYALVSAGVGASVSLIISLGQSESVRLAELAGGALIGLVIVLAIFALNQLVRRWITPREWLPAGVVRVVIFFLGGALGYLLAVELNALVNPGFSAPPGLGGGSAAVRWILFIGVFSIATGLLAFSYEQLKERLRHEIRDQERTRTELEVARSIQERLLPPAVLAGPGYRLAARNLAARYVAGDFYDVFPLEEDGLGLVVADVSGKGVGASLINASVKAVLPLLAKERSASETSPQRETQERAGPARVRRAVLLPVQPRPENTRDL